MGPGVSVVEDVLAILGIIVLVVPVAVGAQENGLDEGAAREDVRDGPDAIVGPRGVARHRLAGTVGPGEAVLGVLGSVGEAEQRDVGQLKRGQVCQDLARELVRRGAAGATVSFVAAVCGEESVVLMISGRAQQTKEKRTEQGCVRIVVPSTVMVGPEASPELAAVAAAAMMQRARTAMTGAGLICVSWLASRSHSPSPARLPRQDSPWTDPGVLIICPTNLTSAWAWVTSRQAGRPAAMMRTARPSASIRRRCPVASLPPYPSPSECLGW